jgi:phosphopantothenoylcysteine decarboxylase/phosphopantothenate--cysteine ligase
MLKNKNILLAVCGSIAAYKAAILTRLLVKSGANVKVIMTKAAAEFISPLTLSTLSKNKVFVEFTEGNSGEWNNHVELALWADLLLVAPASANTIAKMANGLCDNLVLATYLSAKCPVYIAPAMDLDMYKHLAFKKNIETLATFGNHIIDAENGELASGLVGDGRMAEPEHIVAYLNNKLSESLPLYGKTALVTAGPTYEAIDPVRFIGNHSSGKMGFAIAEALANNGAKVILVSGPSSEKITNENVLIQNVVSANEMLEACLNVFPKVNIAVLSAAVADYKPSIVATQKIKKNNSAQVLELTETVDILATLGKEKKKSQILIGFALETENEIENAQKKIKSKNLDFIVLNSLNDKGAGFKSDTNKVSIIDKHNNIKNYELKSKQQVAKDIVKEIIALQEN